MRPGIISVTVLALVLAAGAAAAAGDTAFTVVFDHYEAIREALIGSSTAATADEARAIADEAASLAAGFSAERAGVAPGDAATVQELLPEVRERALKLAAAEDLDATRQAFADLTKPLSRWQKLVEGPRPVVVYCPMEKKAWLQPDGPIGNPYAPSMLRCGEVVQR